MKENRLRIVTCFLIPIAFLIRSVNFFSEYKKQQKINNLKKKRGTGFFHLIQGTMNEPFAKHYESEITIWEMDTLRDVEETPFSSSQNFRLMVFRK